MKNLLKMVVAAIGWKRALALVWDLADDGIKKHVKETPEKWDDEAVKVLDLAIKSLTEDSAQASV